MFRIEFRLSYQDQTCYDVYGHDAIKQIEVYSASQHTLDYMRTVFNHNGDATAFERIILGRQGGAIIDAVHGDTNSYPYLHDWEFKQTLCRQCFFLASFPKMKHLVERFKNWFDVAIQDENFQTAKVDTVYAHLQYVAKSVVDIRLAQI
jgi:hypothetical protein